MSANTPWMIAGGLSFFDFLPIPFKAMGKLDPVLGCVDPKQGLSSTSMTDSIYQYVLAELENAKGSWPAVAKATGMSKRTIEKIARQEVADPGVSLIEKLAVYFRGQASQQSARRQTA